MYRCFVIDTEHEIPLELIVSSKTNNSIIKNNGLLSNSIVHVLLSTPDEFAKLEEKQKLPKPKLTKEVKQIIESILQKRLERYPTSIKVNFNCFESIQG